MKRVKIPRPTKAPAAIPTCAPVVCEDWFCVGKGGVKGREYVVMQRDIARIAVTHQSIGNELDRVTVVAA